MDFDEREPIEWLNYWIEDANKCKQRIILLGDSVTRDLRKKMNFFMGGGYCVDLLAMSYSILDDMVLEEINHFFEKTPYRYDFVIYHMGAHHGYGTECVASEEAANRYESKVREILTEIKRYGIDMGVMSLTLEGCADEESGINHNTEIEKRNGILREVSKELDLLFYDLNKNIDYETIRYVDRCHFTSEDYGYISKMVIDYFFPNIDIAYSNLIRESEILKVELSIRENIYIYGNGIRGKSIKTYLEKCGYRFKGFIVSDEYADLYSDVMKLDEAEKEDALVIVTPSDTVIWKKLKRAGFAYISLGADIYAHINDEISKMNGM